MAAQTRKGRGAFILAVAAMLVTGLLLALGTWQVQRLFWKLDLIARIEARAHAEPVEAPESAAWPGLVPADYEYRRVTVSGIFHHEMEAQTQAVTERGPGYWVMTPLERTDGSYVFINRGFVPQDRRDPATRAGSQLTGTVTVTGLMRPGEPGGGFLRSNDPAAGRWYSRDVVALANVNGLEGAAPWFIDADASDLPDGLPVGGMTRLVFTNNHLVYAVTWYTLAAMTVAAAWYALRHRPRKDSDD